MDLQFTPLQWPKSRLASRLLLPAALAGHLAFGAAYAFAAPNAKQKQSASRYTASAEQPSITYLDQSTGKPIWTGQASSANGGPGDKPGSLFYQLKNVRGTFYQNGTPADRMTAPNVSAVQQSGVTQVTATGGVTVLSISQPDTSMRCDTAVWSSATNQILGTGHVMLKKRGFSQQGSSILIDAKLRTASMPAPSMGQSGAGVHAHFQAARSRPR